MTTTEARARRIATAIRSNVDQNSPCSGKGWETRKGTFDRHQRALWNRAAKRQDVNERVSQILWNEGR